MPAGRGRGGRGGEDAEVKGGPGGETAAGARATNLAMSAALSVIALAVSDSDVSEVRLGGRGRGREGARGDSHRATLTRTRDTHGWRDFARTRHGCHDFARTRVSARMISSCHSHDVVVIFQFRAQRRPATSCRSSVFLGFAFPHGLPPPAGQVQLRQGPSPPTDCCMRSTVSGLGQPQNFRQCENSGTTTRTFKVHHSFFQGTTLILSRHITHSFKVSHSSPSLHLHFGLRQFSFSFR